MAAMHHLLTAICLLGCLAPPAPAQMYQDRKYFYEDIFEPFFTKDEKAGEYRATRPGAWDSRFATQKKPGTFRVFVLGGSIAQRYMSGQDNLGETLRKVLPKMRLEALNCGMAGYDSYREAMVLEEVLQYEPDLIVLMSGHNETAGSPPVPLWILHAQDRLGRLSAYQALIRRLNPDSHNFTSPEENLKRAASFRENLSGMAEHASKAGVPLLLAVPPLNYRDAPTRVPNETPAFFAGWLSWVRRDLAGAARVLKGAHEAAVEAHDDSASAISLFYLARAQEGLGQAEEAAKSYQEALRADHPFGGRCGPVCGETIRQVAVEKGALLADLDAAFRRAAAPGVPGLDMFADTVHWHERFNRLVSLELLRAMKESPAFRGLPWKERRLKDIEREWPKSAQRKDSGEDETLTIFRYALMDLGTAPDRLSRRAVVYLGAAYAREPKWFSDLPAAIRRARTESPGRRKVWGMQGLNVPIGLARWHLGETLIERGEFGRAASELEQASRELGENWRERVSLAAALALAGNGPRARKVLDDRITPIPMEQKEALLKVLEGR